MLDRQQGISGGRLDVYDVYMLNHHIQREIVTRLKSEDSLTFSQLKPDYVDNKLFTYHLKVTVREKFVQKADDGSYSLTSAGKKLWRRMSESAEVISTRAFSVLYLAVHHPKNGWLLYRRKTHPLKDNVGFMHAVPEVATETTQRASDELYTKTGLNGDFQVIGSGFFRMYSGTVVDSFTNFTMLLCENVHGELIQQDEFATYYWSDSISAADPALLPNMPSLLEALASGRYPFFLDEKVMTSGTD